MIPAGYLAKWVVSSPDWIVHGGGRFTRPPFEGAVAIYSVSGCISRNLPTDETHNRAFPEPRRLEHNGFWLFNAPEDIQRLARENELDLAGLSLFYYEVHEQEFDEEVGLWCEVEPVSGWKQVDPDGSEVSVMLSPVAEVIAPAEKELAGYDVVTFSSGTGPECSPLSCNSGAEGVETNSYCLLDSIERAKELLDRGFFTGTEEGPFRIFAVYPLEWP
jgi:hypothetical protein